MKVVVFKGGSMNGIELSYLNRNDLIDMDEIVIRQPGGFAREIYTYVRELSSWVYDHEHEMAEGEAE